MKQHRRFIAGAVCPRCGVQDRIHVFEQAGQTRRACIDCGFQDVLGGESSNSVPEGRLDSPPRKPVPEGASAVRIISFDDQGKP